MTEQIKFPEDKQVLLDLACGDSKREGYYGIDKYATASTDYTFDLLDTSKSWPIADGVVDDIVCNHFFEHIPGLDRPRFMEELYRVLKPGAKAQIVVPYWTSMRSVQDFTHAWPPVAESSFLYFNKQWREANRLTHGLYDVKCDFDYTYGYALDADVTTRNQEYQYAAIKHYTNAVNDLFVTLTKR